MVECQDARATCIGVKVHFRHLNSPGATHHYTLNHMQPYIDTQTSTPLSGTTIVPSCTSSTATPEKSDVTQNNSENTTNNTEKTILNHNIVLTATTDSPQFRSILDEFIDQVDEAGKWVEGLSKSLKCYQSEMTSLNDATGQVVNKLNTSIDLLGDVGNVGKFMRDTLANMVSKRSNHLDQILTDVVQPLQKILMDIRTYKDEKRGFSKLQEKYDYIVGKFASLPRSKEASAVREEEFQVAEVRKTYISASCNHSMRILEFKAHFQKTVGLILIKALKLHQEHLANSHLLFSQTIQPLADMELKLQQTCGTCAREMEQIAAQKQSLEEDAKQLADPDAPRPSWMIGMYVYSTMPSPKKPKTGLGAIFRQMSFEQPLPPLPKDAHTRNTSVDGVIKPRTSSLSVRSSPTRVVRQLEPSLQFMEGWLFKQSRGNKWRRRYFKLSKGYLCYWSEQVDNGSQTNIVPLSQDRWVASAPFNVLLSQVRQLPTTERRFCFEIVSPDRIFVLQAEREVEMLTWIKALEDAKLHSFQTYTPEQISDLSTGKKQGVAEAVQGMLALPTTGLVHVPVEKSVPEEVVERLKYPDASFEKKDQELHVIFKSLPQKDRLIMSANVLLQRDVALAGKIYMTQNSVCFHSNILGYVTVLIVQLKEVISITKRAGSLQNTIVVSSPEAQHTFKTFGKEDKVYNIMKVVWDNVRSDDKPVAGETEKETVKKRTTQELFDYIYESVLGRLSDTASIAEVRTVSMLDLDMSDDEPEGFAIPDVQDEPPSDFSGPAAPEVCGCAKEDHYEAVFDVTMPYSATRVFRRAFAQGSSDNVLKSYHVRKSNRNLNIGAWHTDSLGEVREVRYVMPMNNPMLKVKEATCIETQRIVNKVEHVRYVIEVRVKTPDVPYGDTFDCVTRYCITWKSAKECRVTSGTEVDFVKSTMMKGMIRGAASKGTMESAQSFLVTLKEALSGTHKKPKDDKEVKEAEIQRPEAPLQEKEMYHQALVPIVLCIVLLLNFTLFFSIRSTNRGLNLVAESCTLESKARPN